MVERTGNETKGYEDVSHDERRRESNGVRNGLLSPSFTSPFFPRSYVTRLVTLTSFLGADWVEWEEATRIELKRAEFQPFVDSVLLTSISARFLRMSFTPFTRRRPVRRTEKVNGDEWHAHERRDTENRKRAAWLTALTSVLSWSSC